MRKRVDQLGVAEPEIQRSGGDEIDVALPDVSNATRAAGAGRQDRAAVLLRLGAERDRPRRQAGADANRRSPAAPNAGGSAVRACPSTRRCCAPPSARPTCARPTRPGATAARRSRSTAASTAAGICSTPTHKNGRCAGPARKPKQNLYADDYKPPAGAKPKAVRVNPGTVLVQARPIESAPGKVTEHEPEQLVSCSTTSPVLTGTDITNPQQSFDEGAAARRAERRRSASPATARTSSRSVTKRHRPPRPGSAAPGRRQGSRPAALRGRARRPADHGAVDRLHASTPKGSTRDTGSQISGGFTITSAQDLADELQSGALPIKLEADLRARRSRRRSANRRCTRA